jgi:pimeloyl-ACP methyl ester carboxylesterase
LSHIFDPDRPDAVFGRARMARVLEEAPPVNPSDGAVPATSIELRIDRTLTLPGRAWCADSPRALVAIVHGLGEHCGRYAALASDLVRNRYTVVSLDLPGHGEAAGPRGDFPSWIQVRDQIVPAMFTASRGLPGQPFDLPVILLGHSMGGAIALDYTLAHARHQVRRRVGVADRDRLGEPYGAVVVRGTIDAGGHLR